MKKEKKVVIATHGNLADGFINALSIIIGDMSCVRTICGYTTPEFDLSKTINDLMENHDFDKEELIVCTDMMGGSVNNGFIPYLKKYSFHLITNINLAFLVDLLLNQEEISKELLEKKISDELVSVKYVNQLVSCFEEETDDL